MILTGPEIIKQYHEHNIYINPFNIDQVGPNSYDVRLHNELITYTDVVLDAKKKPDIHRIRIPEEGYVLDPGMLYLGRTVEKTETDCFIPMLEGRSSIGRLGISVHITAGVGDIGFQGFWTLEITCVHPIVIYPGMRIAQLIYYVPYGAISYYKGKYQLNNDIQESRSYIDFEA